MIRIIYAGLYETGAKGCKCRWSRRHHHGTDSRNGDCDSCAQWRSAIKGAGKARMEGGPLFSHTRVMSYDNDSPNNLRDWACCLTSYFSTGTSAATTVAIGTLLTTSHCASLSAHSETAITSENYESLLTEIIIDHISVGWDDWNFVLHEIHIKNI